MGHDEKVSLKETCHPSPPSMMWCHCFGGMSLFYLEVFVRVFVGVGIMGCYVVEHDEKVSLKEACHPSPPSMKGCLCFGGINGFVLFEGLCGGLCWGWDNGLLSGLIKTTVEALGYIMLRFIQRWNYQIKHQASTSDGHPTDIHQSPERRQASISLTRRQTHPLLG